MELTTAISAYVDWLSLKRYQLQTITSTRCKLMLFCKYLHNKDCSKVDLEDLEGFLATPRIKKTARGTYNNYISVFRKFFKFLYNREIIDRDYASKLELVRTEQKIIEYLTVQEIKKLLKVKYPYKRSAWKLQLKDQLLFRLAIFCGLRSSEIRNLKFGDIEWDQKELFIRKGKNLKDRIVPISNKRLYNCLKLAYWNRRGMLWREHASDDEYVLSVVRNGKPMQIEKLNHTLRKCLAYAGIKKNWVHVHMLRHTSATMYLRGRVNQRGMDIRVIQELLGHSSISTTQKYAKVDKSLLRQEMHRASPLSTL